MRADDPVSGIMRTDFVSLEPSDRLDFVDDVMKLGRIRHMPVVEGERLAGIVSQRDLLAASLSKALEIDHAERRTFMRSIQVGEVMSKSVVQVAPETPLSEATRLLIHHKIGCLPVVDGEGTAVGLVTETDLLRGLFELEAPDGERRPS